MDKNWHRASVGAIVVFLIVALAAVTATGCSSASAAGGPLKLTDTDTGKTFTVKAGDTIQVTLSGNATTGYSWIATLGDKDAALLTQEGEPVYVEEAADEMVVGAGGTYTFTVKATAPGQATLKLVYQRSWESEAPAQTFEVQITAE
jgi:inhibitor of cysteine peptidase